MKQVRFMQEEIDKLPTLEERDEALEKLRSDHKEHIDRTSVGYDERLAMIEASPVSQALKDVELAKLETIHDKVLKQAAESYAQELKRIKNHPVKAYCRFRRISVKVPSKCECEARKCTLTFTEDIPIPVDEGNPT